MIEVGEGRRTHHKLSREVEVLPEGRAGHEWEGPLFQRVWERAIAAPLPHFL